MRRSNRAGTSAKSAKRHGVDARHLRPELGRYEPEQVVGPTDLTIAVDGYEWKRAWARLLAKVYEVDPMVCPKCGSEMKVIAIIEDTDKLERILRLLVRIGRSPPGLDPDRLN
ncbi:MAG: hypothetical protein ACLFUX_00420 [Spirochaetaceae bacterium]